MANSNLNPLKDYVDPSTVPDMTVDGLSVNKSYGYSTIVKSINTGTSSLVSPQSTKVQPYGQTTLPNKKSGSVSTSYWTSPKAPIGSKSITAVQFQLKNPNSTDITIFNYLSFAIYDVPANWSLYYQDLASGVMRQATDINGNYVGGRTTGGSTSWITIEAFTQPIGTTLIELRLDRNVPVSSQTGSYITGTEYSFELKNLDLKMIATEWNEVPTSSRITSVNALGFTELYAKRQKDSSQIQTPTVRTNTTSPSSYWKSTAQPFGDAIVSLYVDLGSIQTIDSIYLDPLYSGTMCNIYCSIDNTVNTSFYCSRKQGSFLQKDQNNAVSFYFVGPQSFVKNVPGNTGMSVLGSSSTAGLVCPTGMQINGNSSWSMGISFAPSSTANGSTGYLIDQYLSSSSARSVSLSYSHSASTCSFTAKVNGDNVSVSVPKQTYSGSWSNFPYTIVFGFNANTNQIFIFVDYKNNTVASATASTTSPYPVSDYYPIYLGNGYNGVHSANGYLTDFWIKQDIATSSVVNRYINSTRSFINATGPATESRGDYRSLLMSTLNSTNVYYGPDSNYFTAKQWTPVQNSINVRSATYRIPQFVGRYIKIDFTNLSPQVYPLLREYNKTAKFMPHEVLQSFVTRENQISNSPTPNNYLPLSTNGIVNGGIITKGTSNIIQTSLGATTTQVFSGITQFDLNATQLGSGAGTSVKNASSKIIDPTSNHNYSAFLSGVPNADAPTAVTQTTLASFTKPGTHTYENVTLRQTWNQGYFAGLKSIGFYKTNQIVVDDTEYYKDLCTIVPSAVGNNGSIFATSNFTAPVNMPTLFSPGFKANAIGNKLTSLPLMSFTPVSSFQISANTSDWVPALPPDQALMQNLAINSYLTYTNCTSPNQIPSFLLSTGVWSFAPATAGSSYGPKTVSASLSGSNTGMRCSAAARVYLPNTNNGTYQINLYATIGGTTSIVASKTYASVPLQNWTDFEIAWNVPNGVSITNIQAEVLQIDGSVSEIFYLTMLSPFTHPIGWFYSIDGNTFYSVAPGINNPNVYTSLGLLSNVFYIQAVSYSATAQINSVMVKPQYQQNAYTSSVSVDYFPDPRTNEVVGRGSVYDQPMFKLSSHFFPSAYQLANTSLT